MLTFFVQMKGSSIMGPSYSIPKILFFWFITSAICAGISYLIGFILFKDLFFPSQIYKFFQGLPPVVFRCIPGILLAGGISGCIVSNSERAEIFDYEYGAYFVSVVYCLIYIFFSAVIVLISLIAYKYSLVFAGAYK